MTFKKLFQSIIEQATAPAPAKPITKPKPTTKPGTRPNIPDPDEPAPGFRPRPQAKTNNRDVELFYRNRMAKLNTSKNNETQKN